MQRFAVIGLWLAAVLLAAGCSNGDAPSTAGTPSPPASEAAGPESVQAGLQTEGSGFDPARAYDAQCPAGEEEPSLECEWLRGLVVADVVEALEAIEDSRDQRGVEEALAALDLDDGVKTVNLAPADLKKEGPSFDLPIALAMVAAVIRSRRTLKR